MSGLQYVGPGGGGGGGGNSFPFGLQNLWQKNAQNKVGNVQSAWGQPFNQAHQIKNAAGQTVLAGNVTLTQNQDQSLHIVGTGDLAMNVTIPAIKQSQLGKPFQGLNGWHCVPDPGGSGLCTMTNSNGQTFTFTVPVQNYPDTATIPFDLNDGSIDQEDAVFVPSMQDDAALFICMLLMAICAAMLGPEAIIALCVIALILAGVAIWQYIFQKADGTLVQIASDGTLVPV